jgi:hypothetical protein
MDKFSPDDPDFGSKMRGAFGPGQVDQLIRNAVQVCWMMLPDDKKTVDELEKQLRRVFDRAVANLRDDSDAFGLGK